jgi:hypothetical protein
MDQKRVEGSGDNVRKGGTGLHPAWVTLIRHCQQMGYGEIERLKIQDGIPVMAEKSIQRLKLT